MNIVANVLKQLQEQVILSTCPDLVILGTEAYLDMVQETFTALNSRPFGHRSDGGHGYIFGLRILVDNTVPKNFVKVGHGGWLCACNHEFIKHHNYCSDCSCKGFEADNLEWLIKNRSKR